MNSLLAFFGKDAGLAVGEPAPRVHALTQDGTAVDLADLYARGPVFLYFYLRAGTPVCTHQACRLRDGFEGLRGAGVQIVGVSGDPPARLRRFAEKYRLPFRLLADPEGEITRAFRVPVFLGFPARMAFLIRDGRIAWRGRAGDEIAHLLTSREAAAAGSAG